MALRQPLHGKRKMRLFKVLPFDIGAADEAGWLTGMTLRAAEAVEQPLCLVHDHTMLDRAGRGNHHVGSAVIAREIMAQPVRIDRAHALAGAEDRAADRLIRERAALQ